MNAKRPLYTQGCALLYDAIPQLGASSLQQALKPYASQRCDVKWEGTHVGQRVVVRGRVYLDEHEIHLISVATPADDTATKLALTEALLSEKDRVRLLDHRAYIHCLYAGGSSEPLKQLRALYQVAGALISSCAPAQALGLIDVPMLQAFATPEVLELLRWLNANPPPVGLWVRIVGLSGEGEMWLTTRGMAHFFKPEIAITGRHVNDAEGAEALLMSIALWLVQDVTQLHPNDTLEMLAEEGLESRVSRWRCNVPNNDQRWLASPYGTIILEPA